MDITAASDACQEVIQEVSAAVIADERFFENVLLGVLSRGNVLIEDVPGTGKTLTARAFATALGLSFSRIQFTPDLLPSDITGTHVYNEQEQRFEFREGPLFANVILGDEINRSPPKTQAALLEAMEEGQVTVEGDTRQLNKPFFVLATQNPVEQGGTFPLPEAQVDRFLIKTSVGYPDYDGETELLDRRIARTEQAPSVSRVLDAEDVEKLQSVPENVHVTEDIRDYIVDICRATRQDNRVDVGVSPRGTQRFLETARSHAVYKGRDFVNPDDVKRVAKPVLVHRLVLTPEATVNDIDPNTIIDEILTKISVPTLTQSA